VVGQPYIAALLAWLVPGAGHAYLGRRGRGAAFFSIVVAAIVAGWWLDGQIYRFVAGQPLSYLGTLAEAGSGLAYFVLRFLLGYEGDPGAAGFEYGKAFLITAGLMNLLLVLDAWDIAHGKKT
jgi:hypothetical protein